MEDNNKRMDMVFHSLSDSTRRKIIEELARKELTISEIASLFSISMAAVSKHINVLVSAGLVDKVKIGRSYKCRLHSQALQQTISWMTTYGKTWRVSESRIERELQRLKSKK